MATAAEIEEYGADFDWALERIEACRVSGGTDLDLSGIFYDRRKLKKLPEVVGELKMVTSVDLEWTEVSDVSSLSSLTSLSSLDLERTHVIDISSLSSLTSLRSLNLSWTRVRDISSLSSLTSLSSLYLQGADLTDFPPELYQAKINCAPAFHAWFKDLRKGSKDNHTFKLQIVGNGRVGKTSLIRRLLFDEFDPAEDSTHGIQLLVSKKPIQLIEGTLPVELIAWDFGGQEIYHQIHRLFVRNRGVVMLVFDKASYDQRIQIDPKTGKEDSNRKLSYWLSDIAARSPESTVIVVENKVDELRLGVDIEDDVPEGIKILGPVTASAEKGGSRMDQLRQYIQQAIDKLPHANMKMPLSWWGVREDIMKKKSAVTRQRKMTVTDFEGLCSEYTVSKSSIPALLAYLDALGALMYDAELFPEEVILDQAWALDGVYSILERIDKEIELTDQEYDLLEWQQTCEINGGEFTARKLPYDREKYGDADRALFLKIMLRAGICFETNRESQRGKSVYVMFHFLPKGPSESAQLVWERRRGEEEIVVRYVHRHHLHRGIYRDLVEQINGKIEKGHLWQDGLVLKLTSSETVAWLEMNYDEHRIELRVRGPEGERLVMLFHKVLDEQLRGETGFERQVSRDGEVFFSVESLREAEELESKYVKDVAGRRQEGWRELLWCAGEVPAGKWHDFDNLPEVKGEPGPYLEKSREEIVTDLLDRKEQGVDLPEMVNTQALLQYLKGTGGEVTINIITAEQYVASQQAKNVFQGNRFTTEGGGIKM